MTRRPLLRRRLPTLPHSFPCSTIGPAGLNFRVRDGNGWNPRGMITDFVSQLPDSSLLRQGAVSDDARENCLALGGWLLALSKFNLKSKSNRKSFQRT